MKIIPLIILAIFISTSAFSQTYKWVDEKGVIHFTDDINKIPDKYRSKTEKMGMLEEPKKGNEPSLKGKEDHDKDLLGRGEEYWKTRVDEWQKRLKTAQEKLEQARIKYNELTEKFNDTRSSVLRTQLRNEREHFKQEIDLQKDKIDEAKAMLEKKIPEEAELYKARPEWIEQ